MRQETVETRVKWLRDRGKKEGWDMAAMTGQDARALRVFIQALELYVVADEYGRGAATIILKTARDAMQPQCRAFAKKAIPSVLDWGDEETLWAKLDSVGLLPFGKG